MVLLQWVGDADVDELIVDIFARSNPPVDVPHLRNAEACCYICKVERAD